MEKSKPIDIFKTKSKFCSHGYPNATRVNDIELLGKVYRQMQCSKCGAYKVEINPADYVPQLKDEIIKIKKHGRV